MEQHIKLIEQKDWEYSLYQRGATYELVIPLGTPQPGYDVLHVLNETEMVDYASQGMAALAERLVDMRANFTQYQHQAWR